MSERCSGRYTPEWYRLQTEERTFVVNLVETSSPDQVLKLYYPCINAISNFYHNIQSSDALRKKSLENIVWKEESAGNQYFPLFLHVQILYLYLFCPKYPFAKQALVFTCLLYMSPENTIGKG